MAVRRLKGIRQQMRDNDPDFLLPQERLYADRVLIHGDVGRAWRETFDPHESKAAISNVHVLNYIQKKTAERSKRYELSADWWIQQIAYIARSDVRNFYNEDGSIKPIHDLDEATAAALESIEVDEHEDYETVDGERRAAGTTRTFKYKRISKMEALKLLAKFKLMSEHIAPTRSELTGAGGSPLNTSPPVVHINFVKSNGNGELGQ